MFFNISSALLKEDNELSLLLFIHRYEDGRIFIEFDDLKAAENWIGSLSKPHKDRWSNLLRHSIQLSARFNIKKAYPSELIINIADIQKSNWDGVVKVTLNDAFSLIDQSIKLALENSRNDLLFLKTLLSEKHRKKIDILMSKGHLEVLGGGIGELKKILESRGDEDAFRLLSWTMFDSDATYPGEVKKANQEIIDVCDQKSLVYHCLTKRSIENYIDQDIYKLTHQGPLNSRAKALYSLGEDQISYFNMKSGLSPADKASALYKDLPPETLVVLERGFGDRFAMRTFSCVEAHEDIHEVHRKNSTLDEFGSKLDHLASLLGRPV
ncbi:hypothetical protein [Pseudomonas veronii]|uniref:hypothetical protein n=1 Tax=Pseudomonas veronii TaxID=76761 RepID=UPI002D794751|nr:hypothetical protein [Pseudomonas veronii]WRU61184.1 hypothetical protein VPH48_23580 [Pseudomonas veronii]